MPGSVNWLASNAALEAELDMDWIHPCTELDYIEWDCVRWLWSPGLPIMIQMAAFYPIIKFVLYVNFYSS